VIDNCKRVAGYLRDQLERLQRHHPKLIRQVRGEGLLLGAELEKPGAPIVDRCREAGLLINCTVDKVLRFTPPLIVRREEVDEAMAILSKALHA